MGGLADFGGRRRSAFQRLASCFLSQPGLPFASLLSAERIERVFARHGNFFGVGRIYSTALVVWAFLGQALRDGKEASCQAAVARVIAYQEMHGAAVPTSDTGDYCHARQKLSEAALRDVSGEIAAELEDAAQPLWLWKGQHAKLVDGFTFTMPDTAENQAQYPSPKTQKKGVGLRAIAPCWVICHDWANVISAACSRAARVEEVAVVRSPCRAQYEVRSIAGSLHRTY